MQKKLVLLSPANRNATQEKPRLPWGKVLLVIACGCFVAYGAFDLLLRTFSLSSFTATQAVDTASGTFDATQLVFASEESVTLVPLVPERVRIPALTLDVAVQHVGQTPEGKMANPKGFTEVAWYKLGSKPGAPGHAVIAGHLNNARGSSGVFEKLGTLELGSEIVVMGDGREIRYVVREMHVYDADTAPAAEIFSTRGPSKLILITCNGAWDAGVRSYDKRLVVVAEPI